MLIYRVKFKILSAAKKTDSNSCPVSLVVYRGDKLHSSSHAEVLNSCTKVFPRVNLTSWNVIS
jgi:hypothetical protein